VKARIVLRVLLLLAALVGLAFLVLKVQEKRTAANAAADDIEERLAALDAPTRAAVLARLGRNASSIVRGR
jgi:lipopolysaccharide export system protein LptC